MIEAQVLKEMHRPCWSGALTWFGLAGVFFLLAGFLGWAVHAGDIWLSIPVILLLAHLMHCHLIVFHEAAHGTLCPVPWLNDAIGTFIGLFGFMSLSLYRSAHHYHHAYLATERDEELWPFVIPGTPRWLRRLAAALELTLGLFYTPALFLRSCFRGGSPIRDQRVRRRIRLELGLIAAVWIFVLIVIAWSRTWTYLAVVYLAPALLAGNLQSWRKYIEHMGLTGETVLGSTRSVIPSSMVGRFFAFSLFNEPYHGVHHKYGQLPQVALPAFRSVLVPETAQEQPPHANYRRALVDMLGTLRDPHIGAQWLRHRARISDGTRLDTGSHSSSLPVHISQTIRTSDR